MTQEEFKAKAKKINERVWVGLIIIGVGIVILLRNLDFPFPSFLFTWPVILILVGVASGIRERFQSSASWIMMGLGVFFLLMKIYPDWHLSTFFWPAIIIAVGLSFLLKGDCMTVKRKKSIQTNDMKQETFTTEHTSLHDSSKDVLDAAAIFGVVKKNIYAKNFKGGEVVTVFGGSEINLMNADFNGEIKLEIVNIFGGTTLFVPPHWQIRSEAAAVFGSIEDKRAEPAGIAMDKVLIIDGFVMMGGIDIKSR